MADQPYSKEFKTFAKKQIQIAGGGHIDWEEEKLLTHVSAAVRAATREGAVDVAKDARTLVPWDTGALGTSIEVKHSKFDDGGYLVTAQGPGKYERFYATFVELGTSKMDAKPFLRPALKKNKSKIIENFRDKLK